MRRTRIAVVQICPKKGLIRENMRKIRDQLRSAVLDGAELVLFPECSLTGYSTAEAAEIAVSIDCEEIQQLRAECDRLHTALCFGYIERGADGFYITQELYFNRHSVRYRKTHLGLKEQKVFREGQKFPVLEAPVVSGMQLCWESHIPEISAAERAQGAELLLVPYAYPAGKGQCLSNWNVHLPARASDNGCFLAACNLLFEKNLERKGGGIAVYDYKGRLIASYQGTEEYCLLCDLTGTLPRDKEEADMHHISYFDRKRKELF